MNRIVRLKNDDDIKRIKDCGLIIHSLFKMIQSMNLEGLTTWELDSFIEDYIMKRKPVLLLNGKGYPFASCVSVNSVALRGSFPVKYGLKMAI